MIKNFAGRCTKKKTVDGWKKQSTMIFSSGGQYLCDATVGNKIIVVVSSG